jgi:acyl-homoserine-lactone acylase
VSSGSAAGSEEVFDVPFDPADPVNTPRGLNTDNPLVGRALGDAISDLKGAGIPIDGTLRDFQYDTRGGKRIPIHGGPGTLGDFNAINVTWDPKAGYPDVPHGSSFIAAMTWAKHGCPVRQLSFVTYSESENQSSPHSSDYTRAFSKKKWNKVPFCTADIREQAKSVVRVGR